jgi:cold shock CspA family protein
VSDLKKQPRPPAAAVRSPVRGRHLFQRDQLGTLKTLDPNTGHGLILPDDSDTVIAVFAAGTKDIEDFIPGDRYEYDVIPDFLKRRPLAVNLRLPPEPENRGKWERK